MCGAPIMRTYSELCPSCQDESLTVDEVAHLVAIDIENGNLLAGINTMMHDGDIRVDSVKVALRVTQLLVERQIRPTHHVVDQLIRLIDTWETE